MPHFMKIMLGFIYPISIRNRMICSSWEYSDTSCVGFSTIAAVSMVEKEAVVTVENTLHCLESVVIAQNKDVANSTKKNQKVGP